MNRFEYSRPTSVADAIGLLSDQPEQVAPLAGGTDLLSLMKDFVVEPKRLVSLMGIAELRGVKAGAAAGSLVIGATTTIDELLASGDVKSKLPALWQAADGIKSPQLRTMGTVGGELLQRPRCWYFRHGHGLLATDEKGESLVAKGDHRYHAVFGNGGAAKFVSPSSLAPALIALGASIRTVHSKGGRGMPVADLYRAPTTAGEREHALGADELLAEISIPPGALKSATYEVRPRQGLDWPLAAASVALAMDGDKVKSAVVVLGHVAPKPWIADGAAKALAGQELNEKTIAAAADAAVVGATPLPKNAYKVDLAKVAVRRALASAAGRAA
jgi:xanthine dehydrogenase YagS FAD-binding subunit